MLSKSGFAPRLVAWQRLHGRHDLPWQNTHDPYRIWLAEIMLQQTQVASVIQYYHRFLQRCAQRVMREYGGIFPRDVEMLITLPGVGRSTASAIAACAYGAPQPILD